MDRPAEMNFGALLCDRGANFAEQFDDEAVRGQCILLTGAGGSIGSALAQRIAAAGARRLILLDHCEQALFELQRTLPEENRSRGCEFVLGDVRDESLIATLLREVCPDMVLHAAAFKHVPLLEENPFAAVQNNGLATWQLAQLAAKSGVSKLLLISTDKAANPVSMLGASKRLAELAVLRWSNATTRMCALRLGNVAGSSGSVLPAFREQIDRGGPVLVTHPEASRYFLTMAETCSAISTLAVIPEAEGIFLPGMGAPISIVKLAERMIEMQTDHDLRKTTIRFCGLRPGDKMHEDLLAEREWLDGESTAGIRRILGDELSFDRWDTQMKAIDSAVKERDLAALLDVLGEIVPEYRPGASVTAQVQRFATAAGAGDD